MSNEKKTYTFTAERYTFSYTVVHSWLKGIVYGYGYEYVNE